MVMLCIPSHPPGSVSLLLSHSVFSVFVIPAFQGADKAMLLHIMGNAQAAAIMFTTHLEGPAVTGFAYHYTPGDFGRQPSIFTPFMIIV